MESSELTKVREFKFKVPVYDAALVHGYWMSEPNSESASPSNELSLRSWLAAQAGAQLIKENRVGTVAITIGKVWGEGYPSEGELMKRVMVEKYDIPESRVKLVDVALDTDGEVKEFLSQAQNNKWRSVLDVAFPAHFMTIPDLYKKHLGEGYQRDLNVEYEPVDEVLKHKGGIAGRAADILKTSKYERGHYFYEGVKKLLAISRLGWLLRRKGSDKAVIHPLDKLIPMDKYKL